MAEQQQPPGGRPCGREAGRKVFFCNCLASTVTRSAGRAPTGSFGPDLTHLMSRETLGSGAAPNTPEKLRAWVHDPQELKEGCLMPDMQLSQRRNWIKS